MPAVRKPSPPTPSSQAEPQPAMSAEIMQLRETFATFMAASEARIAELERNAPVTPTSPDDNKLQPLKALVSAGLYEPARLSAKSGSLQATKPEGHWLSTVAYVRRWLDGTGRS
jgi:hypothetical protein